MKKLTNILLAWVVAWKVVTPHHGKPVTHSHRATFANEAVAKKVADGLRARGLNPTVTHKP